MTYTIYLDSALYGTRKQYKPVKVRAKSLSEAAKAAQSIYPNTIMSMGWPDYPKDTSNRVS